MGAKKEPKEPQVKDATITEDGCVIVELNHKIFPHRDGNKVLFTPELLLQLAVDYGIIPPVESNDFPGVAVVDVDTVYADEGEGEEEEEEVEEKA